MYNKLLVLSITALFVCAPLAGAWAQSPADNTQTKAVNAGNKICPVLEGAVDGKTTVEYKGKIYNFCCPACIAEFNKDPQKYVEKVNKELAAEKDKGK